MIVHLLCKLLCEYLHKNELFSKTFLNLLIRGPGGFDSWEKITKIFLHCLFKLNFLNNYRYRTFTLNEIF